MKGKFMKFLPVLILAALAMVLVYQLGRSNCKVSTLMKEKEVIKYVEHKKSDIYVKPNASRNELLDLMRAGKL